MFDQEQEIGMSRWLAILMFVVGAPLAGIAGWLAGDAYSNNTVKAAEEVRRAAWVSCHEAHDCTLGIMASSKILEGLNPDNTILNATFGKYIGKRELLEIGFFTPANLSALAPLQPSIFVVYEEKDLATADGMPVLFSDIRRVRVIPEGFTTDSRFFKEFVLP